MGRVEARFRDKTLKKIQIYKWHINSLEGEKPSKINVGGENIIVHSFIEDDCRLTVSEIASGVGINYSSAQAIITDHLGYRKI